MQAILLCNWNAKSLKTHTGQTMITADIEAGAPNTDAPNTDAAMPTADAGMRTSDAGMRTSDARIPASG